MANFNGYKDYYEHINVKNVDMLLAQIDNISKINDRINECCSNLDNKFKKIESYWNSDTVDKDSYIGEAQKNTNSLVNLISAVKQLNQALNTYAQRLKNASSQSID